MTKAQAIAAVENGATERICAPGEWIERQFHIQP
jgi:hypothetical protein